MPSPPPFVIIPMRLPCAGGWPETARAMSNNSTISRQRIPPACLIAASYILSLPAMDPVWDAVARAPALLLPAFTTRTGLLQAFILFMKARPSLTPSIYNPMTVVSGS